VDDGGVHNLGRGKCRRVQEKPAAGTAQGSLIHHHDRSAGLQFGSGLGEKIGTIHAAQLL
jgi:hypothetical protein